MPRFETSDGVSLFYQDWGSGEPVVLLHAWPLSADMWERQLPVLVAAGLRCVAPDRRGFGRSDQPGSGYTYDRFADDIAELIERLDLRRVTLVGCSMGGAEIVRYLSRHGDGRIARAVMIGTVTPVMHRTASNPDGPDEGYFAGMLAAIAGDRQRYMTEGAPGLFGIAGDRQPVSAAVCSWAVGLALQASVLATLATARCYAEADLTGEMGAVTVPTLVVHGGADPGTPLARHGIPTAAAIPGSRLVVYEGAPHGLFVTEAERLNRDLIAFVRGS